MAKIIRSPRLEGVPHGFSTRGGLTSEGVLPGAPLCKLVQVHSADVIKLRELPSEPREGDALVTDRPGLLLGIVTADCAPVLLADREAGVVGAAHAGWRGARGGVLETTSEAMESRGASAARIEAAIGDSSKAGREIACNSTCPPMSRTGSAGQASGESTISRSIPMPSLRGFIPIAAQRTGRSPPRGASSALSGFVDSCMFANARRQNGGWQGGAIRLEARTKPGHRGLSRRLFRHAEVAPESPANGSQFFWSNARPGRVTCKAGKATR